VGLRSSRRIERACCGDVAFKVITAMQVADHSTIAEFRRRRETRSVSCSRRCWRCAARRGWCGLGRSRSTGAGCARTLRGIATVALSRSSARSFRRPSGSTRRRTSVPGRRAGMNCLSGCAPARVAARH
jgi:hypothetical protein